MVGDLENEPSVGWEREKDGEEDGEGRHAVPPSLHLPGWIRLRLKQMLAIVSSG